MVEWQTVKLGNIASINQSTYSPKENWKFVNYLDTGIKLMKYNISTLQWISCQVEQKEK